MGQMNSGRLTSIVIENLPEILTGIGVAGTIITARLATLQHGNKAAYWKLMFEITGSKIYLYKYLQMTKTNNWLKMHGYPMRRRIRH